MIFFKRVKKKKKKEIKTNLLLVLFTSSLISNVEKTCCFAFPEPTIVMELNINHNHDKQAICILRLAVYNSIRQKKIYGQENSQSKSIILWNVL